MSSWWKRTIAFAAIVLFFYLVLTHIFNSIPELQLSIVLLIASIVIERCRISKEFLSFGFQLNNKLLSGFLIGLLWSLVSMSIFLLITLTGGIGIKSVTVSNTGYFTITSLLILVYAMNEEIVFRGVIFQSLISKFSPTAITIFVSFLFSSVHFFNSSFGSIPFVNTFLSGVLFSVIYLKTESLWLPVFAHYFWNWSQAVLIGSPVSGFDFQIAVFSVDLTSFPELISGGQYGIEGGIITSIILIISIYFSLKYLRTRPEIKAFNFRREFQESLLCSKPQNVEIGHSF